MYPKENNEKDIAQLLAWKSGNQDALMELLDKYMPLILKAAYDPIVNEKEDMRQDLILNFMENAAHFEPEKNPSFAAYIKQKIYWAQKDILRKAKLHESREFLTLEDQEEPSYEPDWDFSGSQKYEQLIATFPLTTKQKQLLLLCIEGKSTEQIKIITGMKQQSICRMKQSIQRRLQKQSHHILGLCHSFSII